MFSGLELQVEKMPVHPVGSPRLYQNHDFPPCKFVGKQTFCLEFVAIEKAPEFLGKNLHM